MTESRQPPGNVWDATLYDSRHNYVWRYGEELLDLLAPRPGERVLDLGSGTGHLAARIAESGAEVIGLDASEEMVEQARRNYPQLSFVRGDAADFRFDTSFDAVFSNATLHWVRAAGAAAACIAGALRPGGRFVCELGGRGNVDRVISAIYAARLAQGLDEGRGLNPVYFPSLGEYAALLEQNGLMVQEARLFDRPTRLDGGDGALDGWLQMYAGSFFADLDERMGTAVRRDVEQRLRPLLFQDGAWVIDYRRLRLVAVKQG